MSEQDDQEAYMRGLAAGSTPGGNPDYNNPIEVAAWQTQRGVLQGQAELDQLKSPTNYNSSVVQDYPTYILPSEYYSSSTSYSPASSSRGYVEKDPLTGTDLLMMAAMILGGYAGYSLAVEYRTTGLELWFTTGGFALVTALVCQLVIAVIRGKLALSEAIGILLMLPSGFFGYVYADMQHGSTLEAWIAGAIAAFGAIFIWTLVTEVFKGNTTRFTWVSILAMVLGGYAGHTYYDGTPLQDWLAAGVSALAVAFCAWVSEEIKSNMAKQQRTKELVERKTEDRAHYLRTKSMMESIPNDFNR